jgi:N4-gp56 family major capsid protein
MRDYRLRMDLHLFDNTNVTTDTGLTTEMKTYYDKNLIKNAKPNLVHDNFADKRPIPKNGGLEIEFRRYKPFDRATTPLTEGVTPTGHKLTVEKFTSKVKQYGDYVELSDVLILTALDNNIIEATDLLGQQAGLTLDWVTREVISAGTNVMYAGGKTSRAAVAATDVITYDLVRKGVRALENNNTPKYQGSYWGIACPDIKYDLMSDPKWLSLNEYVSTVNAENNEIGKIANCRFVETTESKVFEAAGASGIDVYSTIMTGANAYATTEIEGGGLQTIVKQLGSAGTSDPLNQRATVGWKAMKTAEILTDAYMLRLETAVTA